MREFGDALCGGCFASIHVSKFQDGLRKGTEEQLTDTGFTVEKDNLTSTLVGHEVRGPWGLLILS